MQCCRRRRLLRCASGAARRAARGGGGGAVHAIGTCSAPSRHLQRSGLCLSTAAPHPRVNMAAAASTACCPLRQPDSPRTTPWAPRERRCVAQQARRGVPPQAAASGGGGGASEQALLLPRRGTLLAALQAASLLLARPAPANEADILAVGPGKQFATIGAALEQAGSGATIEVAGGRWVTFLPCSLALFACAGATSRGCMHAATC